MLRLFRSHKPHKPVTRKPRTHTPKNPYQGCDEGDFIEANKNHISHPENRDHIAHPDNPNHHHYRKICQRRHDVIIHNHHHNYFFKPHTVIFKQAPELEPEPHAKKNP